MVQEYGIKRTQLSRYSPHMVANSSAQMNMFLYEVSDFMKTKWKMLCWWNIIKSLGSSITLSKYIVIRLGNRPRKTRSVRLGTMNILRKILVVEITIEWTTVFSPSPLSANVPFYRNKYDQNGRAAGYNSQCIISRTKKNPTYP